MVAANRYLSIVASPFRLIAGAAGAYGATLAAVRLITHGEALAAVPGPFCLRLAAVGARLLFVRCRHRRFHRLVTLHVGALVHLWPSCIAISHQLSAWVRCLFSIQCQATTWESAYSVPCLRTAKAQRAQRTQRFINK